MSASESRLYAFEHGEPDFQDIYALMIYYLPFFAVAVMLVLLIAFIQKIENKSLALGSWLLALAVVLLLSIIIRLEYIPQVVGWGIGLVLVLILPVIIVTSLLLLVYGVWQKRKMKRSDNN